MHVHRETTENHGRKTNKQTNMKEKHGARTNYRLDE